MTHEYNRQTKKDTAVSNEALAKVVENIIPTINCLKEDIITLKTLSDLSQTLPYLMTFI